MSSRLNELIGVIRGINKVNKIFYQKCINIDIKRIDTSNFSIPKLDAIDPSNAYNAAANFSYQLCRISQYEMSNFSSEIQNVVKPFKSQLERTVSSQNVSNQAETPDKHAKFKKHNLSMNDDVEHRVHLDLDDIDRQMLAEFRKSNPEIISKYAAKMGVKKVQSNNTNVKTTEIPQKLKFAFPKSQANPNVTNFKHEGHERRIPSSQVGRAFSFAGLFTKLTMGAALEKTKTVFSSQSSVQAATKSDNSKMSLFLSDSNLETIVDSLCKMRGAALKLGQVLSIQDEEFVDPRLQKMFERVRQNADFMPFSQMNAVMRKELGPNWMEDHFSEFNPKPFAAASIGQVHQAMLKNGDKVAVKIQYPGVKKSIDSDINNLMSLLKLMDIFPAGAHMERAIEVAKKELHWECDYKREADYGEYFRKELDGDEIFIVPKVYREVSTGQVLTMQFVEGVSLDRCKEMSQEIRDWVGTQMLRLCLIELFQLRTMQTDPNWSNFLLNFDKQKIYLLDFGASRPYKRQFVDDYIEVIKAASIGDRESILHHSRELGFLTGLESRTMENAHIDAVSILGEVFESDIDSKGDEVPFDFGAQTTTGRIKHLIPVMLKERLTPPPEESYSIHRKLSGGFLLCTRLKSRVTCQGIFREIYDAYQFDQKDE